MAVFNADTDVSYAFYLAAIAGLNGRQREEFDQKLIKFFCWMTTQGSVTLDADQFEDGCEWAAQQVAGVNPGPDSPTLPASVTSVPD